MNIYSDKTHCTGEQLTVNSAGKYKCLGGPELTYWVIDKAVTFVINENQSGSIRVWKDFSHTDSMPIFIHILPVFYVEIMNNTSLIINNRIIIIVVINELLDYTFFG